MTIHPIEKDNRRETGDIPAVAFLKDREYESDHLVDSLSYGERYLLSDTIGYRFSVDSELLSSTE